MKNQKLNTNTASNNNNSYYYFIYNSALIAGICCLVIGIAVVIMDLIIPEKLSEFFNVDITGDMEEFDIS